MKHTTLLLAALLAGCAPEGAPMNGADRTTVDDTVSVASDVDGTCPYGDPVAVGRDAIGSVSFSLTLYEVRALCPVARDTSWGIYERAFPGLHVPMAELDVFALQDRTVVDEESGFDVPDEPDPDAPADLWVVSGTGGTLPGGVGIDATLRRPLPRGHLGVGRSLRPRALAPPAPNAPPW